MAKGISNTSRTLEYIRNMGWECDKVGRDKLGRFAAGSNGHYMPHSEEAKKKMSVAKKGTRVSLGTEFKAGNPPWNKGLKGVQKPYWLGKKRHNMRGSLNVNWKGGRTPIRNLIRNSTKMQEWRKVVMQRDKFQCVLCDSKSNKLQVDHIYPFFRMFDESNIKNLDDAINCEAFWDTENGRTLCINCHRKIKYTGYLRENKMTPTQRTLKYLKEQGFDFGIVERWLKNPKHPAGGQRKDLFGIIDIIALGDKGIIGIQSCGQAFAEHNRTILNSPMSVKWLEKGGSLMLIGWRKVKLKRGGKAMRWSPRIKEYNLDDDWGS